MLSMAFFFQKVSRAILSYGSKPTLPCGICQLEPCAFESYLKSQHPEHEHKSQKFFQSKLAAYVKEQRDFEARVTKKV